MESDCTHIHNALALTDNVNPTLFNRLWSKQENPPFNVARIHGSDELACTTRKIDGCQLRDTEAYTVNASVAEFGIRRMYLEIWTTESDRRCSRSTD